MSLLRHPALRLLPVAVAAAAVLLSFGGSVAHADPCTGTPVYCENLKPGNPASQWDIVGSGDPSIQGFAADISVNRGDTVQFKVKTNAQAYHLDIYRLGYYGGSGARLITTVTPSAQLPQTQPACLSAPTTGLVDCGNWAVSAQWNVPADAVSGIYIGKLVRDDTGGASHMVFIVRDDGGHSDLLFQTSDTTWQAYNEYGGNSLYKGSPASRAYKVSYNRPFTTRQSASPSWLFEDEYPMVRWLERNGYDVSYTTGVDTARRGSELLEHKVFLSVGHDEYWSGEQRANVEAARAAGVNLAFLSGNEVFWKTRWEPSTDSSATPYRTLVCYKETAAGAKIDPTPTWTGTWRDGRLSPPSDGGRPENALTGTLSTVNAYRQDPMTVSASDGDLRLWRNTSIANLAPGATATIAAGILGHEWDEDVDNGFRPAGLFDLSSTTISVDKHLIDQGNTYVPGTATHHVTLYRAPSGALVFSAGTAQWSWLLDNQHTVFSGTAPAADTRIQQATVNQLADMGVQPGSLDPALVTATASTDTTAPTSQITSPAAGTVVPSGSTVTITGTASDAGAGIVAGVAVSVDGGATWHRATGRNTWSYQWTAGGFGPVTVLSRAVDDSGNLEPSGSSSVSIVVGCPCSLWSDATQPVQASSNDRQSVELGVRFRPDRDGFVTGLRYYRGPSNPGPHVGSLWTASGGLLARATFTGETATGWQQVTFSQPVAVTANTTYVASYHAPSGGYALDLLYFNTAAFTNGPLTALQSNGVYVYGTTPLFPTNSYSASNYWVDVVFDTTANAPPDTTPPTVASTSPTAGATGVDPGGDVRATFSEPVDPATLTGNVELRNGGTLVPASVQYDAPSSTVTLHPTSALAYSTSYTATVKGGASGVKDLAGNALGADVSWSFTTASQGGCPCSIWPASAHPAVAAVGGTQSVELGTKFRADVSGYVTGIRFYKGNTNTGTHIGSLWTRTGTRLAQVTFSNETASGWQQANFATPVAITAGTTYVVSYFAPNGAYSVDLNYFASSAQVNAPLRALQNGTDGGNGVYGYGSQSGFPTNSYSASNYWVDVVFNTTAGPDTTPPTVASTSPTAGATGVDPGGDVRATFSEPVDPATLTGNVELRNGGTLVPASVQYDAPSSTVTLHPTSALAYSTSYTATVKGGASGVKDLAGNALGADVSWSFTTASQGGCPCSIWPASAHPAVAAVGGTQSVELGTKFRADVSGYVTGIRFYKGNTNTGTHIGSLWTRTGTRLAQVTFSNETASGWQQANFATPVAITAGTTYVVSYFAPNGAYSVDLNYFASSAQVNAPLRALQNGTDGGNGVYGYGSQSGFPSDTYSSSNYWVDVVFSTTAP